MMPLIQDLLEAQKNYEAAREALHAAQIAAVDAMKKEHLTRIILPNEEGVYECALIDTGNNFKARASFTPATKV